MPVDFPRRAVSYDPDDIEPYVARRSLGFTAIDQGDRLIARPARAERLLEPPATTPPETNQADPSPRPRRASFAELLTPDADEEKSTATETGIGRRAIDPFPETIKPYAPRADDAIPVQPQPTPLRPLSPPASRALPPPPESHAVPPASSDVSRGVLPASAPASPAAPAPSPGPAAQPPSSPASAAVSRPPTTGGAAPAPQPVSAYAGGPVARRAAVAAQSAD